MCQGVKDTILSRKVVMAVPVGYRSVWVGFLYTEVSRVLLDPGETRVSKKRMQPLLLGASVVIECVGQWN